MPLGASAEHRSEIQTQKNHKIHLLRTEKIMKQKESFATRGSGANNVANVKWAKGTKEGNKEGKGEKESK